MHTKCPHACVSYIDPHRHNPTTIDLFIGVIKIVDVLVFSKIHPVDGRVHVRKKFATEFGCFADQHGVIFGGPC